MEVTGWSTIRHEVRRVSGIRPVKGIGDAWLGDHLDRPVNQRRTARRVYACFVEEYDFKGGESTVRRYVASVHGSQREVYIPPEFDPCQSWTMAASYSLPQSVSY